MAKYKINEIKNTYLSDITIERIIAGGFGCYMEYVAALKSALLIAAHKDLVELLPYLQEFPAIYSLFKQNTKVKVLLSQASKVTSNNAIEVIAKEFNNEINALLDDSKNQATLQSIVIKILNANVNYQVFFYSLLEAKTSCNLQIMYSFLKSQQTSDMQSLFSKECKDIKHYDGLNFEPCSQEYINFVKTIFADIGSYDNFFDRL